MRYYKDAIQQYINFQGCATRKEFWLFVLCNIVITFAVNWVGINLLNGATWPATLYSLFIFLPTWAITVRRLHDTGKSGTWLLVSFIPGIGSLILFILLLLPSKW